MEANGSWSVSSSESWLTVEPASGSGDATLTVTVDRDGLAVDSYAGAVLLTGTPETAVAVPVLMDFPGLSGTVQDVDGHVQSLAAPAARALLRPGQDYAPGEILVRLDRRVIYLQQTGQLAASSAAPLSSAALASAAADLAQEIGAHDSSLVMPALGLARLRVADADVSGAIAALERDGRTRYAEPNFYLTPTAVNDPHVGLQWHYPHIGLEQAWAVSTGYEGSTVAVIDADFYPDHPDLAANMLAGYDFAGDDTNILIQNPDCGAHGTHVAGTIAAVANNALGVTGIAYDSRVLPLNVGDDSAGCLLPNDAIARAIFFAAGGEDPGAGKLDAPVDVINMSLGGPSYSQLLAEVTALAVGNGVTVVAAAGNDNGAVGFPAGLPDVIAVSATDIQLGKAFYSNFGPEIWIAAPGGDTTQDLNADGYVDGVLSTIFDYETSSYGWKFLQGTSMASPHVAGAAALLYAANPDMTPAQAMIILAETATDLGVSGRDSIYGFGLLDASAAVQAAAGALEVPSEALLVRLKQGATVVAETHVSSGGAFSLGPVIAGTYTLEAGNLRDGELGVEGTVYGSRVVTIAYDGNRVLDVPVTPQ